MKGFKLRHHQRTFFAAFVIIMGYFAFRGQRAFGRDRVVKDQLLFTMQHAGQIDIAGSCQLGHEIIQGCDTEAGYDL